MRWRKAELPGGPGIVAATSATTAGGSGWGGCFISTVAGKQNHVVRQTNLYNVISIGFVVTLALLIICRPAGLQRKP